MKAKTKGFLLTASIVLATTFTLSCSGDDGNKDDGGGSCSADFETVTIGTQTWAAKNLNCDIKGSLCYHDDPANCTKYGRLYDWATAMGIDVIYNISLWNGSDVKHKGICPSGWHIPSNDDWNTLMTAVGGSLDDSFDYADYNGRWWSATESSSDNAYNRPMHYDNGNATRDGKKSIMGSVRCVKD